MKYYILTLALGMVGAFKSTSKDKLLASAYRSMPAITNSLVNLGKMDVSFYINAKDHEKNALRKTPEVAPSFSSFYIPKNIPVVEEPCPCSMMKNLKETFSSTSNTLLNKILTSNDLFSFKNPMTSPLCCESHEEFQDNVFFDIGSKMMQNPFEHDIAFPAPVMPFDSFLAGSSDIIPSKSKTIEIVFLPKKNFETKSHTKKVQSKKDIAIVGKEAKAERFNKSTASTTMLAHTVPEAVKKEEKVLSPEDLNRAEQVPVKDSNSLVQ